MEAFNAPYSWVFEGARETRALNAAAERCGIIALGTELSGGGTVTPRALRIAERGLRRALAHLGVLRPDPADAGVPSRRMQVGGYPFYVYATDDGVFEPLVALEEVVAAGQPAALIHPVDTPWRPPRGALCAGRHVVCARVPGRVERGDCLFHLAVDRPAPSTLSGLDAAPGVPGDNLPLPFGAYSCVASSMDRRRLASELARGSIRPAPVLFAITLNFLQPLAHAALMRDGGVIASSLWASMCLPSHGQAILRIRCPSARSTNAAWASPTRLSWQRRRRCSSPSIFPSRSSARLRQPPCSRSSGFATGPANPARRPPSPDHRAGRVRAIAARALRRVSRKGASMFSLSRRPPSPLRAWRPGPRCVRSISRRCCWAWRGPFMRKPRCLLR